MNRVTLLSLLIISIATQNPSEPASAFASTTFYNPLTALLPIEQANLILLLLMGIPLSLLLSMVYNKYLFLALSMTFTIGFQSLLFPEQKYFLWGQQQIVYLLIWIVPRKYVGHAIMVQSFSALITIQLRRFSLSYGVNEMDITAIFMMQLFNYVGMGYNYANGAVDLNKLTPDQIKRRIVDRPNYLTYLGYVTFLPACLVGPVYQYTDFEQYLNRTADYKSIPSPLRAVAKQFVIFASGLVLYEATSMFSIEIINQPQFLTYSYFYKLLFIVLTITHIELKYVTAWSLGMIGLRASGITYNPHKNKINSNGLVQEYNFGRVEVNNLWNFFFEPSIKVKGDNWNISVQWALRRYVYQNIYPNTKDEVDEKKRKSLQAKAQLLTVIVSALWHGLYLGYYISFVHWILYIQIAQEMFRVRNQEGTKLHYLHKNYTFTYNLVDNIFSTFVLTYFGMAFHLMIWTRIEVYLVETYFAPYIILYIAYYLIVHRRILSQSKSKKKERTQ